MKLLSSKLIFVQYVISSSRIAYGPKHLGFSFCFFNSLFVHFRIVVCTAYKMPEVVFCISTTK